MVTLKNKITEIKKNEKEKLSYFDLMKVCAEQAPKEGLKIQQINKRIRIINALEKEKEGKVEMEDADFDELKSLVVNFTWGIVHKDIVNFYNYIQNLNGTDK